jgi:hypothetical protein
MGKSASFSNDNNPHNALRTENPRATRPRSFLDDSHDPYIADGHPPDGTICTHCSAFYENQHWNIDPKRAQTLRASGAANEVVCPGCRKIAERNPHGVITLSGDYWPQHRDDILNLVRNEEARGIQTNPLERIIDIREDGKELVIETTNEKLAQRIGRAIHSAHKGEIEYKWPEGTRLVRVLWERTEQDAQRPSGGKRSH